MKKQWWMEIVLIVWWNLFCLLLLLWCAKGVLAQPTSSTISPRAFGSRSWRENGLSPLSLPITGNSLWDVRLANDGILYYWNGSSWVSITTSSGEISHGHQADVIDIFDDGGYYTGVTVESALQENGSSLVGISSDISTIQTSIDSIISDPRWTDARTPLSHVHAASDVTSGTFADARISSSSVTQYEGALESVLDLQDFQGAITDAQVPDTITKSGIPSRCARFDSLGVLTAASADCPDGDTVGGGGSGSISGSTGLNDNLVLRSDGTGGSTLQDSKLRISDDGSISTIATPMDFSPAPVVWLKADSLGLSDNNPVSLWADSSGNSHHFSQSNPSMQPIFQTDEINGLPIVRFDGGDCLFNPSITISTFSIFVVFRATTTGMIYEHSQGGGVDGSYLYGGYNNTISVQRSVVSSLQLVLLDQNSNRVDWSSAGTWRLVLHRFGGNDQSHRMWVDGSMPQMVRGSDDTQILDSSTAVTTELNLGCRHNSSVFLTGDIAEFIVFSPRLSGPQERSIILYLQTKYSL